MRILTSEIGKYEGQEIEMLGWVDARRDHGKLIFIDMRDRSGIAQCVFIPKDKEVHEKASRLRSEWVIALKGQVNRRPDNMVNKDVPSGQYEILVTGLEILNEAQTPPIAIDTDGYEISEEVRMKYRYIDLKRARLQKNLKLRSKAIIEARNFLAQNDFTEVETPVLSKSTPEGARDYLVPSRVYPGNFYALPQSPQQYKQLLMVAGLERYYQVAKCFRDEDTRGDRQPEFTQLDMELSFTDEKEVMALTEELVKRVVKVVYPDKEIKTPFQVMTYKEAMEKYQSDKPDLRTDKNDHKELAFLWVIDFPIFEYSEEQKRLVSMHHPFTAPQGEDMCMFDDKPAICRARAYDLVLNGFEVGGGSIRIHSRDFQEKIFELLQIPKEIYEAQFGHLLTALDSGAPPHGGLALGLDRLFAILFNEPNIREVMAFPKTGDARDLMMGAPSEVDEKQLKELNLKITK